MNQGTATVAILAGAFVGGGVFLLVGFFMGVDMIPKRSGSSRALRDRLKGFSGRLVAGLAVVVLSEHPSVWRLIWGGIGVVGVALVVLGPQAGLDALGVAAGLGGAVSMGLGVVLTKRWGRPDGVSALSLAGWQLTGAGLLLIVPALVIDGVPAGIDATAVAGYSWLGLVGGLAAYVLWFEGIRRLPVTPTTLLGLLSPLTAALLGHVIAGEALTPLQLLGFALALTAMSAGQLAPPSSRSSSRKDPS